MMLLGRRCYDAFGQKVREEDAIVNWYQFAGEQFDSNLGSYYLRQRYYDTSSGRFTRQDTYEGGLEAPLTLHKYIYANANPVAFTDPSGYFGITEVLAALTILVSLTAIGSQVYVNTASLFAGDESPKDDVIIYIGYSPQFTALNSGVAAVGHAAIQVDNQIYDYPRAEPDGLNRFSFVYDEKTNISITIIDTLSTATLTRKNN
jgi:RHS repeat-associated protein